MVVNKLKKKEEEQEQSITIIFGSRLRLKCDGTRAKTRFLLSAKPTSPFKPAGASIQSTTGSRVVRISGSNAGYTMFRGSVKGTGYLFHSPVPLHFPTRASPCSITFQLDSSTLLQMTLRHVLANQLRVRLTQRTRMRHRNALYVV